MHDAHMLTEDSEVEMDSLQHLYSAQIPSQSSTAESHAEAAMGPAPAHSFAGNHSELVGRNLRESGVDDLGEDIGDIEDGGYVG
jgi:hypothetical protein